MDKNPYRCDRIIDIEEIIMEKKYKNIMAIAIYNSGREEVIKAEMSKGGKAPKKFEDKLAAFKNFPAIKTVKVEKY